MKKILLILTLFLSLSAYCADKLHVKSLQDFSSQNPSENFYVELLEDGKIEDIFLSKGDKINCSLFKIKDPKRAKIDAKIYFKIESYENSKGLHEIQKEFIAKYAQKVLNKESIKQVPKKKIAKTALSVAGGAVVEGANYIVSFTDGLITNQEGNRLKSGAKQLYDDSFLSYIEKGGEIEIKVDDEFYFIVKLKD